MREGQRRDFLWTDTSVAAIVCGPLGVASNFGGGCWRKTTETWLKLLGNDQSHDGLGRLGVRRDNAMTTSKKSYEVTPG